MTPLIKHISEWLVDNMVSSDIIAEDDVLVQKYGLELFLSLVITLVMLIGLIFLTHRTLEIIWAVLPFAVLRGFSGGWHADTHFKCIALFMSMVMLELLGVSTLVGTMLTSQSTVITLALISLVSVFTFAPVASETKPLSEQEQVRYRRLSRVAVVALLVTNLLIYFYVAPLLGTLGVVSMTFQALSLIPHALTKENLTFEE